ncbi:hypothetical protein [Burkholderia gladioli]|uniref:hypothetical protein n=1 Tax=Burkholderia gladioli TaxID=28095 RepID=UPI001641037A|nr:hypothetical protein [Burkholderia gladioli]
MSTNEKATSRQGFMVKLGALAAGLAVVAYVGLHLGRGDLSVPGLPALSGGPSAPAAHVLTPEEQVQAEIAANPALVSRQACMNLYFAAPGYLGMLSHPDHAELDSMSDSELRSWAMTSLGMRNTTVLMVVPHDQLVSGLLDAETKPLFASNTDVEKRRINAYLTTCRAMYPGRDEATVSFLRTRVFFLDAVMKHTVWKLFQ